MYLNDFEDNDDEESDDKESDDEESDYKEACHEESDDKEEDSNDDDPLVTVLDDSTDVDLEVSNEDSYDLDLSLSAVVNVIAHTTFTTGATFGLRIQVLQVMSPNMQKAERSIVRQVFKHKDLLGKQFNLTARWIFQSLTLTRIEQRSSALYMETFRQMRSFTITCSV